MMQRRARAIRALPGLRADQAGQATIEWTLLLVCFGIPMIYVLSLLLSALTHYYRMVTFFETLPYP